MKRSRVLAAAAVTPKDSTPSAPVGKEQNGLNKVVVDNSIDVKTTEANFVSIMYSSISSCTIPVIRPVGNHMRINVLLKGLNRSTRTAAMIDSGATGLFISEKFIRKHDVRTHRLKQVIPLLNINGSHNINGAVTQFARLTLTTGDYTEQLEFLVTDLGPEDVILGLPWLKKVNPKIDFKKGTIDIDEAGEQPAADVPESFQRIAANRYMRKQWKKQGIIEDASDERWVAAGCQEWAKGG